MKKNYISALFFLVTTSMFGQLTWERVKIFESGQSFKPYHRVVGLSSNDNKIYAFSSERETAVSEDGINWTENQGETPFAEYEALTSFNNKLFLFDRGLFPQEYRVWSSSDEGDNWFLDTAGLTAKILKPQFVEAAGELWLTADIRKSNSGKGLFKYNQQSNKWISVNDNIQYADLVGVKDSVFVIEYPHSSNGFAYKLLRSGDKGTTWNKVSLPVKAIAITKMIADDDKLYLLYKNPTTQEPFLGISSDYGNSWDTTSLLPYYQSGALTSSGFINMDVKGSKIVIAQTAEEFSDKSINVIYSTNGGQSFIKSELTVDIAFGSAAGIYNIHLYKNNIYLQISEHLYKSSSLLTSIFVSNNNNSKLITFPNPVQNTLFIDNKNVIGKKVDLFSNDGKSIEISNSLYTKNGIDISNLESGLYFIKIGSKSIKFIKE